MIKNTVKLLVGIIAATAAAFVVQSCTEGQSKDRTIPKTAEPVPVKVIPLEKSMGVSIVKLSGQLTTDDETTLAFKTAGVVRTVQVKEGDRVRKGQLLATLDLTEIESLVSQARHGYEKAQRDFQRVKNLYQDSVVTLEQYQNAETGLNIAREQLETAQFNKNYSAIHATADGYVLHKFVNAGQVVGVGDPVLTTNGASKSEWILKAGVSDKQWSQIDVKNKAEVTVDAFKGELFDGIVTRKSETSDPRTGAFTIEITIQTKGKKLASGMFGAATFKLGEGENSWNVPYEAVLDANDDEGFVFITNDDKTAIRQPVVIQSFNGESVRIAKGLENAKYLIISGSAYLADQSPVTIVK